MFHSSTATATIHLVVVGGCVNTFGLFFKPIQERFDTSATATTWVAATMQSVGLLTMAPANLLCKKVGTRPVVVMSGLLLNIGYAMTAFVPKLWMMYFTYGLVGVGGGLCYGPSMVIIGIYFEKRRALANGIAFSASSFGAFCFPPLIQYCLDSYGLQGTLLIMGGVMFHISAAGMLFRPPEFYQIQRELLMRQIIHRSGDMNIHQSKESGLEGAASDTELPLRSLEHSRVTATSDSNPVSSEVCHGAICSNNDTNRASDFASPHVSKVTQEYDGAATTQDSDNLDTEGSCRSTSDTTTCTNAEACTLSVSGLDTRSDAKISPDSTQAQKAPSQWNILKKPLLYIYALTLPLTDSSFVNCSMIVYPYATDIGISNFKSVFLVSILGISRGISSFLGGFLSDFNFVEKKHIYLAATLAHGIAICVLPLMRQYMYLAIMSGLCGSFSAAAVVLAPVLVAEELGTANLPVAFGVVYG
ncbi:hypothetical protein LSAT2_027961 [Lamellibrachia satsuma]|nr:hypothetical protein LSAT2_027961 [Lamellibrachia satsuma]